jgi:hypothetical protein
MKKIIAILIGYARYLKICVSIMLSNYNISYTMKSRLFRAALFLLIFILITILFYGHQLVLFPIFFLFMSLVIVLYLDNFLGIFEIIENNSSSRYWEIKQDHDTDGTIQKIWIWNFLCSFRSLFFSNLFIALTSIFFLYKLDFLSNKDPTLLILVSTTVVILIRVLVYSNREIAREIGKGFRYAMFPFGYALFFWDFLYPLAKQYGNGFIFYIVNNNKYIEMLGAVLIAVFVITSLEPIFGLFSEIQKYSKRNYKSTETRMINWVVGKLIKK